MVKDHGFEHGGLITHGDCPIMSKKVINVGDWNMQSTASVRVVHGMDLSKIRGLRATIRNDSHTEVKPLTSDMPEEVEEEEVGSPIKADATHIELTRMDEGAFNNSNYNRTNYNRGWITVEYQIIPT